MSNVWAAGHGMMGGMSSNEALTGSRDDRPGRRRRRRRLRRHLRLAPPPHARLLDPRAGDGRRSRRHVVLEPLSRRPLRRAEPRVLLRLLEGAAAGVGVDRDHAGAARRSRRTSITSSTGSTCAATFNSAHASRPRPSTRTKRGGSSRPTAGERLSTRFCVMATGCLSAPTLPDVPGRRLVRGSHPADQPVAERGRRPLREAGRARSAPVRRACRPRPRSPRRPTTSTCSNGRRPIRSLRSAA